jgi:alpha-amylase
MPSVCFYFQVHQPFRIERYRFDHIGKQKNYFEEQKNKAILKKVANKCYLPTNHLLLKLIRKYQGRFKISFSITGTAIEQMQEYYPEVLESFQELADTGCVEFLAETYHHSLAALYSPNEFRRQIKMHQELMKNIFNQRTEIFRNTELIYQDEIGQMVADLGFKAIIAEGADDILDWRSSHFVYKHPERDLKILTKSYSLSDDIAFRFSNKCWAGWPLTTNKYASWLHRLSGNCDTVNLFMDYETFGEHQWEETGIFNFLSHLPEAVFSQPDWQFKTPSETISSYPVRDSLSYHRLVSWADIARDLTAWNGNEMQNSALARAFALEDKILERNNPKLTETWRRLLTSDHFYYICTKFFADGDVHAYFSPFKSPYEAFISYMNVLTDLENIVIKTQAVNTIQKSMELNRYDII